MITSKRIEAISNRYNELMELAHEYDRETNPKSRYASEYKLEYTTLEKYVNTSCHCHPEYEWVRVATMEEFGQWIDNKIKKQNEY